MSFYLFVERENCEMRMFVLVDGIRGGAFEWKCVRIIV